MAVNSTAWRRFPVAERDQSFNVDNAIKRIQQIATGSVETFNTAFLWRDSNGPPNNKNSYRLPIADVINGRMTLVPHAVFTAAAILSGAHGGLEGVVGEEEKAELRNVVTRIYTMLRDKYSDPRLVPPWERDDVPPEDRPNRQISTTAAMVSAVNSSVVSLPLADKDREWSRSAASARLWEWADQDFRKYRQGFLWWDSANPEEKGSYKLPVADVQDGKLVLVPRAVNAVSSVLAGGRGGVDIPEADATRIAGLVERMKKRIDGGEDDGSMTAAGGPLKPPKQWFADPQFSGPTKISVTADGRVAGHLAEWNVCHLGLDPCRMAPHSNTGYRYFMNGTVVTADGSELPVGLITTDTTHADIRLGYVAASDHYSNTGNQVAVVSAGEDPYGIWVAGALVPEASEQQAAVLRRSKLSGDWRPTRHGLELVEALAVNNAGFPVVSLTASGQVQALVAAGMVLSPEERAALQQATAADHELVQRLDAYDQKAAKLTKAALKRRLDRALKSI